MVALWRRLQTVPGVTPSSPASDAPVASDPVPNGQPADAALQVATDRLARAWMRADVCWYLGCSEGTLDRLIAESGFPPGVQLGHTTLRRWRPADVQAWFEQQFTATPARAVTPTSQAPHPTHARPAGMGLPRRR